MSKSKLRTASVLFREETSRLIREMSDRGYRVMFERINSSDLGVSVWIMWLNLKTGEMLFTMTDRVGRTDYYNVVERDCYNDQPKRD